MTKYWIASSCFAVLAMTIVAAPAFAVEVKEVVSPGGIKAWLIEEHSLPLVAVSVSFEGSGSAYDKPGLEGRANMAAAMLTEGAGDMPERVFSEALESHAIHFNTSADEDRLDVTLESLSEHKDLAFSYLALAITKPRFDEEAIERTRRQLMTALTEQEQNPGYRMEIAWRKQAFGSHPYAQPPLGTEASLRRIDRDDLSAYAEHYLTRENIYISVVGDVTPDELKALLDKHFAGLPKQYKPDVTVPEVQILAGGKPVVMDFDIPQTLVAVGLQGLKRSDPDYITAHVTNQVIGGSGVMTSRLGRAIREERGLAYSVSSHMHPLAHGASWDVRFATRNEQAHAALDIAKTTLAEFAKTGPAAKELADAKRYLTGSFVLNLDSNADLAAFLINMQVNKLGIDYLKRRNQLIEAVNKDDVKAMAKRLIDADKLTIVMVGKPKETKP